MTANTGIRIYGCTEMLKISYNIGDVTRHTSIILEGIKLKRLYNITLLWGIDINIGAIISVTIIVVTPKGVFSLADKNKVTIVQKGL
ncbi:hypothetical protein [Zhenhengia yiwuensis]|uniref:Uncharacterized protein n=1 Tax=Zhenhengia yiwuensis TaxID=2763666 RepID=A0A926EN55_9FIRM|nr:hypothetical protein [Zhenhengia yiwuensis]MBC8581147.1 hypothetical protein [Zhenhengia yiwuensis]